jgi:hypothetical protein
MERSAGVGNTHIVLVGVGDGSEIGVLDSFTKMVGVGVKGIGVIVEVG